MSATERIQFVGAIDALRAYGGLDCPELAIKGMIDAIDNGPKFGSPMFVFTDASAKDATVANIKLLKKNAKENSISINFFISGRLCWRGTDAAYKDIAASTSGK